MNRIFGQLNIKLSLPLFALAHMGWAVSACAYRFTNAHIGRVAGMQSIAIEAIYDTSREVLPHEVLWEAFQRAFASNGHLRVVSRRDADLLMRAHVTQAAVTPSGIAETKPERDPAVFEGGRPPYPGEDRDYKRLTVAREYATKENVNVALQVEIWQLSTGRLVMQNSYGGSGSFDSVRRGPPLAYSYIRHDEALTHQIDIIANRIASSVVTDFLLSRASITP